MLWTSLQVIRLVLATLTSIPTGLFGPTPLRPLCAQQVLTEPLGQLQAWHLSRSPI
jgi:hypothetical protein